MNYKYFLSVCTCIKNEKKYIDSFIEHYLQEGVNHIYIINNGSTDNIEEYIDCHKFSQHITLINDNRDMKVLTDNSGPEGHRALLNDNLYDLIRKETQWAAIVDADEYIYGKNGHTIRSFLLSLDETIGCIYVLWNIINPLLETETNRMRLNYDKINELTYNIKYANDFGKSIVRTSMLRDEDKLWLHKIKVNGLTINNYGNISNDWCDNCNNIEYSETNFDKLNITLNHYAIRDINDYNKKLKQINVIDQKKTFIQGLFEMITLDKKYLLKDTKIII